MRFEWIHQCNICHTSYDTRRHEKCPNCHNSKDCVRCTICNAIYDTKENRECPTCHSSLGSVRCAECNEIINGQVNFCPSCGVDRRWKTICYPNCYADITVLKRGGLHALNVGDCSLDQTMRLYLMSIDYSFYYAEMS